MGSPSGNVIETSVYVQIFKILIFHGCDLSENFSEDDTMERLFFFAFLIHLREIPDPLLKLIVCEAQKKHSLLIIGSRNN